VKTIFVFKYYIYDKIQNIKYNDVNNLPRLYYFSGEMCRLVKEAVGDMYCYV